MTKTDIYRIALRQHGKTCTEEEVRSDTPPYEVVLCNTYYDAAVRRVLGETDWSFLLRRVEISETEDLPEGRWAHGFVLPFGILRVAKRSTKPYQLLGNRFMTDDDDPDIYVIQDAFEPTFAPRDICTLVGLALAYELCGILAPADNAVMQLILQSYSWTLQPMIAAESPSIIRSPEEGGPV